MERVEINQEATASSRNIHRSPLMELPKELIGDILHYCSIHDCVILYTTCKSMKQNMEDLLRYVHHSFDWAEERGKIGGLEFLYRLQVPVESITLDTTSVVALSHDRRLPTGDPLQFLAKFATTQTPLSIPPVPAISSAQSSSNSAATTSVRQRRDTKSLKASLFFPLRSLIIRGMYSTYDAGLIAMTNYRFPNLQVLILSYLPTLSSFSTQRILLSAPLLTHLSLERSHNAATDETLAVAKQSCPKLRTLSLAYCSLISDSGLRQLAFDGRDEERATHKSVLLSLQELSLAHCYELSSDAISTVVRKMPNLMVLSLEWCFHIDDGLLITLADTKNRLTVLGIEHCERISDEGLSYLIHKKPAMMFLSADSCSLVASRTSNALTGSVSKIIQDLYLNSCPMLSDEDVLNICKHCTQLRSLGIEDCNLTDTAVVAVAENCPHMTVLGLNNNYRMTDFGLQVLLQKLATTIERLYLSQTSITNSTLLKIAENCQTLYSLSLIKCDYITFDGLKYLGDHHYACAITLQDLHLSVEMKNKNCFYHGLMTRRDEHEPYNADDEDENGNENSDNGGMDVDNIGNLENIPVPNGNMNTIAVNHTGGASKLAKQETVDVQLLIFGTSLEQMQQLNSTRLMPHQNCKGFVSRCIVYFR